MNNPDPYWRLRPPGPTPADEVCNCAEFPPIVLQDHLSEVPLACLRCNGEIPPERVGFSEALSEKIHFWWNVNHALMMLWLDSDQYEDWARAQLEDPNGQVNVVGLAVVEELNRYRRTYYWWFQDNTVDGFTPISACPRCGGNLAQVERTAACELCSIVFADNPRSS